MPIIPAPEYPDTRLMKEEAAAREAKEVWDANVYRK